ncbi:S8 family peptidase [Marinobacter goseongensis]|jgi:subtilisin family serine protease|uniref:S8 family peptidase n=1 Tax=Marinobacter goseongensis TaxID=453838 RepID=UPI002004FBAC|nr:S8 family peptidase [Marinobacter goseongensis]MCK7551401.1 S8 family peptidase [Marinobacter goseongensis]
MTRRLIPSMCLGLALAASAPMLHGSLLGGLGLLGIGEPEPSVDESLKPGDLLPGRYIITLDSRIPELLGLPSLQASVESLLSAVGGGEVLHLYGTALTGAAVTLTEGQASLLSALPGVLAVEPDRVVTVSLQEQQNATWGLDRVDQSFLPLDSLYRYPVVGGAGSNVYIIDTGIRPSHAEFSGRVIEGRNFAANQAGLLSFGSLPLLGPLLNLGGEADPTDVTDCNGHGTHVASTAVGTQYGVAKSASVAAVRVLDCSGAGANADVIAGVDWVAANHQAPAIANMSLGGGNSVALDNAVRGAIAAGVTFVVAAGNNNTDACSGSPNRVERAITVGSTTRNDQRSSFSNFGSCVDVFAPGSNITAAWFQSDTETNTISGTSMASPHVAGMAALILGEQANLSPDQVAATVLDLSTSNVLSGLGAGSPNLLMRVPQ